MRPWRWCVAGGIAAAVVVAGGQGPAGATGLNGGSCSNSNYGMPAPAGTVAGGSGGPEAWINPQPSQGDLAGTAGAGSDVASATVQGDSSAQYLDGTATASGGANSTAYADGTGENACAGVAGVGGADANVPVTPTNPYP